MNAALSVVAAIIYFVVRLYSEVSSCGTKRLAIEKKIRKRDQ